MRPSRPSPLLLSAVGGLAGLLDGPDKLVADGRIDHLPRDCLGRGRSAAADARKL